VLYGKVHKPKNEVSDGPPLPTLHISSHFRSTMKHINPSIQSHLKSKKPRLKPASYYIDGIVHKRDYYILSESITLLESEHQEHQTLALEILSACYPHRVPSIRYGVTGSPGVGKSTFIDSVAGQYVSEDHRVGILTVDPSSADGKGSVLGDKTRMEELIKDRSIFIRPSPSNRHLGGLNQYTYEAIVLCEAAGIDRIFVETVGVGQSEVDVSHNTDITILLVLPGSGDSLQGIKKGVIEKADIIIIHKSDGDAAELAKRSAKEFGEAIHLRRPGTSIPVINYSSLTTVNKDQVIEVMEEINQRQLETKLARRRKQEQRWLDNALKAQLESKLDKQLKNTDVTKLIGKEANQASPFAALIFTKHHLEIQLSIKD